MLSLSARMQVPVLSQARRITKSPGYFASSSSFAQIAGLMKGKGRAARGRGEGTDTGEDGGEGGGYGGGREMEEEENDLCALIERAVS